MRCGSSDEFSPGQAAKHLVYGFVRQWGICVCMRVCCCCCCRCFFDWDDVYDYPVLYISFCDTSLASSFFLSGGCLSIISPRRFGEEGIRSPPLGLNSRQSALLFDLFLSFHVDASKRRCWYTLTNVPFLLQHHHCHYTHSNGSRTRDSFFLFFL